MFRWRHQARLERMEAAEKEKKDFMAKKQAYQEKLRAVKTKLENNEGDKDTLQVIKEEFYF